MNNNFYVYEYFIIDTDEVFYVGKGTGNRVKELHNRNNYFKNVYKKYKCDFRFYKTCLTNKEACEEEIIRIKMLKTIGQAKCNLTNGGDGFSSGLLNPTYKKSHKGELNQFYGKRHTEETKRKISQARRGKGGRLGKNNSMYGKNIFAGEKNPMYGITGLNHPNSSAYIVTLNEKEEVMTFKQCEKTFGIAFLRVSKNGGILHYKKKTPRNIYEGVKIVKINNKEQRLSKAYPQGEEASRVDSSESKWEAHESVKI